jgi:acetylornithine/succinyldiaminopimelate/putrescine aminotransferase
MKDQFYKYQAQTSPHPLAIEVVEAKGMYIYDKSGKSYLDFVAGVSANTLGHQNKKVNDAIKNQLDKYSHVMVYGEFIQEPSVLLSELMCKHSPDNIDSVYLLNSGTEAAEAALKLAKRVTGRTNIVSAKKAYHGNTMGALSVCGIDEKKNIFRPLIPGNSFVAFNNLEDLEKITKDTAAVILETIQGGAGFIVPKNNYLQKVQKKCREVGALLILDEIQAGIGRTGSFFGFQNFGVKPDIIICGKGLGGGMPIGAMMANKAHMDLLQDQPKLGHITTFGGHPVISAAALATLTEVFDQDLIPESLRKEDLIRQKLKHPKIKEIRGKGLMLGIIMETSEEVNKVIFSCLDKGLILFWLLYENRAIRMSPPLNISDTDITKACNIILSALDELE